MSRANTPPSSQAPSQVNKISLWLTDPDTTLLREHQGRLLEFLSAEEQQRAARFVFDQDRSSFVVAHALVRVLLARRLDMSPCELQFTQNPHGRPELSPKLTPSGEGLFFNLSRSRGLVAVAIGQVPLLGVDVEARSDTVDHDEVARSVFAQDEQQDLQALQGELKQRRFYDYWTLKESYIKARGMGLSLPLDKFSFAKSLRAGQSVSVQIDPELLDEPQDWAFWQMRPSANYTVALACKTTLPSQLTILKGASILLALE